MNLKRPHYGTEFRVELVDATTDKSLGMTLLTTQCVLQYQRDLLVSQQGISFLSLFNGPTSFKNPIPLTLELRSGMKTGYGAEFFAPSIPSGEKGGLGKSSNGSGYLANFCN